MRSVPTLWCAPSSPAHTWEVLLCQGASKLALLALRNWALLWSNLCSNFSTRGELQSPGAPGKDLPSHGKCTHTTACTFQSCPCSGSAPLPQSKPIVPTSLVKCCTSDEKYSQHCTLFGRALQTRSARASPVQPQRVHLHDEKEKHEQDEEAQKLLPLKPTGELT